MHGNMTTLLIVRSALPFLKIGQTRNIGSRWASSKVTTRSSKLRKQDFEYCVDLVQNRDREGYLCGLLMPYQSRRSYFAIRAFNVELASIKDGSVSRQVGGAQFEESGATMALKVRVQWWRDAISQIYGDDKSSPSNDDDGILASMASSSWNNPVVRVLDHAVHESNLTRRFLERLLEMREDDLDVKQLDSLTDAIAYAEGTFSSLFYLSLETVNVSDMVMNYSIPYPFHPLSNWICVRYANKHLIWWRIMLVLAWDLSLHYERQDFDSPVGNAPSQKN